MDDSRYPSLALRAIRLADVRFGILPAQSRLTSRAAVERREDDDEVCFVAEPNWQKIPDSSVPAQE